MKVNITDKAEEMLRALKVPVITIDIAPACSCSATAEIDLKQDELRRNDVIYEKEGLILQCTSYGKEYIGEELNIDYKTGFRLFTPKETIAYGMSVQRSK